MRRWLAVFYKDFCLFLRGSGRLTLLLPFFLLAALKTGQSDPSQQIYVQPFPVAVRDLDDTVMSRSLLSQMEQVALFSEIKKADGETDEELLSQGVAAVVTIPKDFFYELYTMEDCPVEVVLNDQRKLESALFSSIFSSVMDIIWANQSAERGLFRFCYGDDPGYESEMYAQASEQLLRDALGRQNVFDAKTSPADPRGALSRRLLASILTASAILFSTAALKTLPEERKQLVLPRYRALGGSPFAFIASKFVITLCLYMTVVLLILKGLSPADGEYLLWTASMILFGAFGLILALSAWTDSRTVQLVSNLFLLLSLVLGGSLWPAHMLPPALAAMSRLTLPYYARRGLELAAQGAGGRFLWQAFVPVLAMGLIGSAAAIGGLYYADGSRRRAAGGLRCANDGSQHANNDLRHMDRGSTMFSPSHTAQESESGIGRPDMIQPCRMIRRLAGLACLKGSAMVKGIGGVLTLGLTAFLCGAAVHTVEQGAVSNLRLVVCDTDQSVSSQELIERLSGVTGLSVFVSEEADGRQRLLGEEAEGLLVIGEGYGLALEEGSRLPLSYESAAAAWSSQGVREIVAGQVIVQRSRLRAVQKAEERLGRALSESETRELMQEISEAEGPRTSLYQIRTSSGRAPVDPFVPGRLSLVSLAVLFTLLTVAPWSRNEDGRLVEKRMYSIPYGRTLSYGSDAIALMGIGLWAGAAILILGETSFEDWMAMTGYVFGATGLSLALMRFTAQEGRVDGIGPFLALILCLAGGCFMDLTQAVPWFAQMARWTLPGQMLLAGEGERWFMGILLAEGALFLAVGAPRRDGSFSLHARPRCGRLRGQKEQHKAAKEKEGSKG